MAATNRERVAKHAAARQAAGGRRVTVWLTAEAAAALDRMTVGGISTTFAVCSAVETWDAFVREAGERMLADAVRDHVKVETVHVGPSTVIRRVTIDGAADHLGETRFPAKGGPHGYGA